MLESEIEGFNRATLYHILNRFREDGIVHRIIGIDGKHYFALCSNCEDEKHKHDHIHFQCTECNKVECLKNELNITLPFGYAFKDFNGVVSGVCDDCG